MINRVFIFGLLLTSMFFYTQTKDVITKDNPQARSYLFHKNEFQIIYGMTGFLCGACALLSNVVVGQYAPTKNKAYLIERFSRIDYWLWFHLKSIKPIYRVPVLVIPPTLAGNQLGAYFDATKKNW